MQAHFLPPPDAVGDVNSTARGSGARYNGGKPAMDLIPLHIVAASFAGLSDNDKACVYEALYNLGRFQITSHQDYLDMAIRSLRKFWPDAAKVFDYGRRKYAEWNWAKGMDWNIPVACAARHALKVLAEDELLDEESGESHIGHMLCNLVMLKTFAKSWPSGNNLPDPNLFIPPGPEL